MQLAAKCKELVRKSKLYALYQRSLPSIRNLLHIEMLFPLQVSLPLAELGCGGWGYCIAPDALHRHGDAPPVVYAFGLGDDISFEEAVISELSTTLYAFDAMPAVIAKYKGNIPHMRLIEYALSDHDGTAMFYFPVNPEHISGALDTEFNWHEISQDGVEVQVRRLSTIMNELSHDHIDLLKLNIEGAEYYVIPDILAGNPSISQISMAVHGRFMKRGYSRDKRLLTEMNRAGYRVAHYDYEGARVLFVRDPA